MLCTSESSSTNLLNEFLRIGVNIAEELDCKENLGDFLPILKSCATIVYVSPKFFIVDRQNKR